MNPTVLISAIVAAVSFGSGWHLQTLRYIAKEAEHERQKMVEVRQSAATAIRRLDSVLVAQSESAARASRLRGDVDRARAELDRLRTQLLRTMPGAEATPGACVERANTTDQLLLECADALSEMAGKADRHANDAKTLIDAWPK